MIGSLLRHFCKQPSIPQISDKVQYSWLFGQKHFPEESLSREPEQRGVHFDISLSQTFLMEPPWQVLLPQWHVSRFIDGISWHCLWHVELMHFSPISQIVLLHLHSTVAAFESQVRSGSGSQFSSLQTWFWSQIEDLQEHELLSKVG